MTKEREALKLALNALEYPGNIWHMNCPRNESITAIKEALAQPETPPECQTEAEKTAFAFGWFKAMEAQRLAQPKQEPVGVVALDTSRPFVGGSYSGQVMPWSQAPAVKTVVMFKDLPLNTPLYIDPPQRPWVGLDFETIEECFPEGPSVFEDAYGDNHTSPRWLHAFARAIESRLKEKNT